MKKMIIVLGVVAVLGSGCGVNKYAAKMERQNQIDELQYEILENDLTEKEIKDKCRKIRKLMTEIKVLKDQEEFNRGLWLAILN